MDAPRSRKTQSRTVSAPFAGPSIDSIHGHLGRLWAPAEGRAFIRPRTVFSAPLRRLSAGGVLAAMERVRGVIVMRRWKVVVACGQSRYEPLHRFDGVP